MTTQVQFKVEEVTSVSGQGVLVVARRCDDVEFRLNESTTLGGCPIVHGDIPRALDEFGELRMGLWGFFLKNDNDREKFGVGDIVYLESEPRAHSK